jgi:tRNA pseudouridine13 synthase
LNYDKNGIYTYVLLKKRNYNTLDSLKILSRILGISLKQMGFAGNKDKKAITSQYISLPRINENKINNIRLNDIHLKFLGYGNKRISLGDLKANKFRIKFPYKLKKIDFCENYFDDQRFGDNNHLIGKLILKKDFKQLNSLIETKDNYEYNIRSRFYFNSYQSYLFNLCLSSLLSKYPYLESEYKLGKLIFLKKKIKNFKIPILSFDTQLKGEIGRIYKEIMKKEQIKLSDFLIRKMPFIISDTTYRDAFFEVKDLVKKKDFVYFTLPKGSYATIFMKKLMLFDRLN